MIHEPEPGRRQRTRARRTDAILQAAAKLIAAQGIEGLTMGKLAEVLDVAPGGLYRYFSSKDALIAAVQVRTVVRIEQRLRQRLQRWQPLLPADPAQAALAELFAGVRAYRDLERQDPQSFRMISASLADPEPQVADAEAREAAPAVLSLLELFASRFAQAEQAAALDPGSPLERTVALWSAVHGARLVGKLARLDPQGWQRLQPDALALTLTATLLRGWGAEPQPLEAAQKWVENTELP